MLAAAIPVVEHLAGLDQLPPVGARFTAVPLRIEGPGTIPVGAFARLAERPDVTDLAADDLAVEGEV
jgi:kynurenine formamidase